MCCDPAADCCGQVTNNDDRDHGDGDGDEDLKTS